MSDKARPRLIISSVRPLRPGFYEVLINTTDSLQPGDRVALVVGRGAGHALLREMERLCDECDGGRLAILDAHKVRNSTVWAVIVGHCYDDGIVLDGAGGLALFLDESVPDSTIGVIPEVLEKFLG